MAPSTNDASSSLLYGPPTPRVQAGRDLLQVEAGLRRLLELLDHPSPPAEDRAELVDFLWRSELADSAKQLTSLDAFVEGLWRDLGSGRRREAEALLARASHRIAPAALLHLLAFYLDDGLLEFNRPFLVERLSLLTSGSQVELPSQPVQIAERRLGQLHTTHWQAAGAEALEPRCMARLEDSRRTEAAENGEAHHPLIELGQLSEGRIGGDVICGLCKARFRQDPSTIEHRAETPEEWVARTSRVIGTGAEAALRDDLPGRAPVSGDELEQAVRMSLWSVVVDLIEDAFAGSGGPLLHPEDRDALLAFGDISISCPPALPGPETAVVLP